MRDNTSHLVVFIGGFLLGSLLTGGVFGTYLVVGAGSQRALMEARMAEEIARQEAMRAQMMAEQEALRAREEQRKAEERLQQLEKANNKGDQ